MPAADKYTNPELRDQVKKEVQASDKGGAPGQWSARKAQFMAAEYKKRGGDYNTDKETGQDESQKNLSKWTEEEWQTKEGSGNAKKSDGTQKRYLPKKAWEQMDDSEKKETDDKKQSESKKGKQFVGNTDTAKKARKNANDDEAEQFEDKKQTQSKKSNDAKGSNGTKAKQTKQTNGSKSNGATRGGRAAAAAAKKNMNEENYDPAEIDAEDDDEEEAEPEGDGDFDADEVEDGADEDDEMEEDVEDPDDKAAIDGEEAPAGEEEDDEDAAAEGLAEDDDDEDVADEVEADNDEAGEKEDATKPAVKKSAGAKRSAPDASDKAPEKKQKSNSGNGKPKGTYGSKHDKDEEPGQKGSADRLPKVGQRVTWKAMPGFVYGKVLEIVTKSKQMQGKSVKASKDDPKIALEADSGKFCVHKPDAMFYD